MSKRKAISQELQARLLVDCARRCALCFGLEGDLERKKVQIAHIDGDPGNAAESNLVCLCMDHHDEYDGSTSQSKGLTGLEVTEYKKRLNEAISAGLLRNCSNARIPSGETGEQSRDRIVIEPFWGVVGMFWAKFRMMMFGIARVFPLDSDVRTVFGVDVALTEGSVDVDQIAPDLVARLFRSVDFSSASNAAQANDGSLTINFEPGATGSPGNVPWAHWLAMEIAAVESGCDRLLVRFGSGSRPEIVEQISLLQNRAKGLSFVLRDLNSVAPSESNLLCLSDFFEHLKLSTQLINRVRQNYQT